MLTGRKNHRSPSSPRYAHPMQCYDLKSSVIGICLSPLKGMYSSPVASHGQSHSAPLGWMHMPFVPQMMLHIYKQNMLHANSMRSMLLKRPLTRGNWYGMVWYGYYRLLLQSFSANSVSLCHTYRFNWCHRDGATLLMANNMLQSIRHTDS